MSTEESFHSSLGRFVADKIRDLKAVDDKTSSQMVALEKQIAKFSISGHMDKRAFFHLIDLYKTLDKEGGGFYERQLLKEIPEKAFERMQIPKYARPKIYRGVPRIYQKTDPSKSLLKPYFRDFSSVKLHFVDKAILSLFDHVMVKEAKVILFTYVMPGGLGDYALQKQVAELIRNHLPNIEVELITLLDEQSAFLPSDPSLPLTRVLFSSLSQTYPSIDVFSKGVLKSLRNASLIIQLPTLYPLWDTLFEKIKSVKSSQPLPRYELIGEYGFVESKYFNPNTPARCMGLHFLEKGILTKESVDSPFEHIKKLKNKKLLKQLFSSTRPTKKAITSYQKENRFYFAYLITDEGHYLYLHALIKMLEKDLKDIDVAVTDIRRLVDNFEKRFKKGQKYPLLEKYGIQTVSIHYQEEVFALEVQKKGKKIRFHCVESLSPGDFSLLSSVSDDFVGCRGDGSFSEVVSANKLYFYDGLDHQRYFLKDLVAIAENKLTNFRATIEFLHIFLGQMRLPTKQKQEWVDDLYFQNDHRPSLHDRGERLGALLQNPSLMAGMKKLNMILKENFSVNASLLQLVKRRLIHYHYPVFELEEINLIDRFKKGKLPFHRLIHALRKQIKNHEPRSLKEQ